MHTNLIFMGIHFVISKCKNPFRSSRVFSLYADSAMFSLCKLFSRDVSSQCVSSVHHFSYKSESSLNARKTLHPTSHRSQNSHDRNMPIMFPNNSFGLASNNTPSVSPAPKIPARKTGSSSTYCSYAVKNQSRRDQDVKVGQRLGWFWKQKSLEYGGPRGEIQSRIRSLLNLKCSFLTDLFLDLYNWNV